LYHAEQRALITDNRARCPKACGNGPGGIDERSLARPTSYIVGIAPACHGGYAADADGKLPKRRDRNWTGLWLTTRSLSCGHIRGQCLCAKR